MKIAIDPRVLFDTAAWVARTLAHRPTMPVLSGLLLEAADDQLRITAFDYDVTTIATVGAEVSEPGRVLVSGKILVEVAKNLPSALFAELVLDGSDLTVRCGTAEYSVHTMPVDDYPTLPTAPAALGSVDAGALRTAISRVVPAAAPDDKVPELMCAELRFGSTGVQMSATESHMMSMQVLPWQPTLADQSLTLLVQAKVLTEVAKGITSGTVQISASDNLVAFSTEDRQVIARLTNSGKFPDCWKYRDNMPATITARLDVDEFAAGIKRVAVMAGEFTPIRMSFGRREVRMRVSGDAGGGSAVVACELDGDELDIAFHAPFILAGLAALGGGVATLAMSTPTKPALLTGDDPTLSWIAMPQRLA